MTDAFIADIVAKRQTKDFAAIDFDNTCIENDIEEALLAYMCELGLVRNQSLLGPNLVDHEYNQKVFIEYHRLLKEPTSEAAYIFAVRTLAGYSPKELEELVVCTIQREGQSIGTRNLFGIQIATGIQPRPEVFNIIKSLQQSGFPVWIITASSEMVVRSALKYFRLEANCIGLKQKIEDGILTEEIDPPFSIGLGKVACITKYIDPIHKPIIGIGDSENDLPMLEYSINPIVVNRGNSLTQKAKDRNWRIINT